MGKNKEILWENDGDIGVPLTDVTDKENFLRHFSKTQLNFRNELWKNMKKGEFQTSGRIAGIPEPNRKADVLE